MKSGRDFSSVSLSPLLLCSPRPASFWPRSARLRAADVATDAGTSSSSDLLSVASKGSMALAVRQEQRSANDSDIFAARIVLSSTARVWSKPALASDGMNVLVAWMDGGVEHAKYALLTPAGPAAPVDL